MLGKCHEFALQLEASRSGPPRHTVGLPNMPASPRPAATFTPGSSSGSSKRAFPLLVRQAQNKSVEPLPWTLCMKRILRNERFAMLPLPTERSATCVSTKRDINLAQLCIVSPSGKALTDW